MIKLTVGIISGAVSIIFEAAPSGVDLLAAVIAYYAIKKSSEPLDKEHAYGHGKIESLSRAVEAVLIVIAEFMRLLIKLQILANRSLCI